MTEAGAFRLPFRKRLYRGFEPALVVAVIAASFGAVVAFSLYLWQFTAMSDFGKVFYLLLLAGLFYCALAYQLNRFGAAMRAARHRPFDPRRHDRFFDEGAAPSVTVLIPSYREERRVVQMTVLSAALAHYANRRIVVLVDDPPADAAGFGATLAAVGDIRELLGEPMARLAAEREAWEGRRSGEGVVPTDELVRLVHSCRYAARWLDRLAEELRVAVKAEFVHVDLFVIDQIVKARATAIREHARRLLECRPDRQLLDREYHRLGTLFCTDISVFARKRFANLSHAANKATNLNAYIGLMGGRYSIREAGGEARIEPTSEAGFDLEVVRPDYVLTLDADSVVRDSYLLELVDILEQRPDTAVAQTPYLTFPGARSWVERVAGATTDAQYLVHQGSSWYNAAFWVGANAVIRYSALVAIARDSAESGHRIFIQDETVIEDTGSTVDLLRGGWSVHNHFTPLAYSATPADFGALTIQRKRWSNGGLIILPALVRQYLRGPMAARRTLELLLRAHYLLSPAIGNLSVFLLMIWATTDGRALVLTPLVMGPHFLLYGLDMRRLGYRFRDVFTVSALNLMLLPVAFAGVAQSVLQMLTGRKGAFVRTPKVADRTLVPPLFFLFNFLMSLLMLRFAVDGIVTGDYVGSIVPAINVAFYVYGMARFVGLEEGFADVLQWALGWLALAVRPFAGQLRALLWAVGAVLEGSRPRLVGAAVFALVVLTPWRIGPDLTDAELARAASPGTGGQPVLARGAGPAAAASIARPAGGAR